MEKVKYFNDTGFRIVHKTVQDSVNEKIGSENVGEVDQYLVSNGDGTARWATIDGKFKIAEKPTENGIYLKCWNYDGYFTYYTRENYKVTSNEAPIGLAFKNDKCSFTVALDNDGEKYCWGELYLEIGNTESINKPLGRQDTNKLLNLAITDPYWKTDPDLTNSHMRGYFPAACYCWKYSTPGTKQGDWYLPSAFELIQICSNCDLIKRDWENVFSSGVWDANRMWTSTEVLNDAHNSIYSCDPTGPNPYTSERFEDLIVLPCTSF